MVHQNNQNGEHLNNLRFTNDIFLTSESRGTNADDFKIAQINLNSRYKDEHEKNKGDVHRVCEYE